MINRSCIFLMGLALSVPALGNGIYGGVSAGITDYNEETFGDGNGMGIRGGYQINDNVAVEVSYFDGGKADDNDGNDSWYIDGEAFQAAVKLSTDIGGRSSRSLPVHGYLKLGVSSWDYTLDARNTGNGTESVDGTDIFYGVGVGWDFSRTARAFLEYQSIKVDSDDVDGNVSTVNIGIEYKF